jgi:RES domain
VARRVAGPGASYCMAPFVHVSADRAGRFHDGTFGAFYAADGFDTAVFEVMHHAGRFCAATDEAAGWIADKREVMGQIDAVLTDVRTGHEDLLAADDCTASQAFARSDKAAGSDGIIYPSARHVGGTCFAAFYPDVMGVPVQGRHITYHWDGTRIDMIRDLGDQRVWAITP